MVRPVTLPLAVDIDLCFISQYQNQQPKAEYLHVAKEYERTNVPNLTNCYLMLFLSVCFQVY